MQSRLEDVLKEKERELKLHEKFAALVRFCEEEVFPFSQVPLKAHAEALKDIIEQLIPEPKDRREEMFSGEIFVLLGAVYLHDIGAAGGYGFCRGREILAAMEPAERRLSVAAEIGRRLDIPEQAMDLIGSIMFSVRKIPIEWEITEGPRKAIIRNAPMLAGIFDFAHLMWDAFSPDACGSVLKRQEGPDFAPGCGPAALCVDAREGTISVSCTPAFPYRLHVARRVKEHVEGRFNRFKDAVNGRLGFQYRRIVWELPDSRDTEALADPPGHFPFTAFEGVPHSRWEEASGLLDTLFGHGYAIVIGDGTTGKTTMVNSFVASQLRRISPNVFYAEIWDSPVHDIREAVGSARGATLAPVDIVSTCKKLTGDGPCFFIVDGCERLKGISADEAEKFERFARFCVESGDVYLLALGDKADFFDWYGPFRAMSLSAVFEVAPIAAPADASPGHEVVPLGILKEKVDEVAGALSHPDDLREVVSVLAWNAEKGLRRYSLDEMCFETAIHPDRIVRCLDLLFEKGLVRRQEGLKTAFWTLASRHLGGHLRLHLSLGALDGKRRVRDALREAAVSRRFLDDDTLDALEAAMDAMMFRKRELGLVLASMVRRGRDPAAFLKKAARETRGFDVDFALLLLSDEDDSVREGVIRLFAGVKDEALVNPLLSHLKKEKSRKLRTLLVEGFLAVGKRKSLIALMATLTEMGDRDAKLHVIDSIYRLPERKGRDLLIQIADVEKDPEMIDRIDSWLSTLEE